MEPVPTFGGFRASEVCEGEEAWPLWRLQQEGQTLDLESCNQLGYKCPLWAADQTDNTQ